MRAMEKVEAETRDRVAILYPLKRKMSPAATISIFRNQAILYRHTVRPFKEDPQAIRFYKA
jgi:hypothetical protein